MRGRSEILCASAALVEALYFRAAPGRSKHLILVARFRITPRKPIRTALALAPQSQPALETLDRAPKRRGDDLVAQSQNADHRGLLRYADRDERLKRRDEGVSSVRRRVWSGDQPCIGVLGAGNAEREFSTFPSTNSQPVRARDKRLEPPRYRRDVPATISGAGRRLKTPQTPISRIHLHRIFRRDRLRSAIMAV